MRPPFPGAKPSWTFPSNNIRLFFKSPTVDFRPNHPKQNAPAQSANPKLPVAEKNLRYAPRLGSPPQRGAPPKAVRGTLSPHTQPPTTKHTQPPPAARKKRTPKPHDTAAIRSADKSPARLENGSGARADRMPNKGTPRLLPTNAEFARPIFQMGNQGDLSKASPAACFFASFFASKKEVRDCQGAHSPLILFRGAPTAAHTQNDTQRINIHKKRPLRSA